MLSTLCPNLTDIGMAFLTDITNDGIIALASNCNQLTSIDMCGGPITETGLMALVTHCQQLNYIVVSDCHQLQMGKRMRLAVASRYPHLRVYRD